jgi:hypothetical protein
VEVSLKELESAYGQFTSENWKKLSAGGLTANKGYRFDNVRVEPVTELTELAATAFKTGTIVSSNGGTPDAEKEHIVAVPIKLRGQTIGVVTLSSRKVMTATRFRPLNQPQSASPRQWKAPVSMKKHACVQTVSNPFRGSHPPLVHPRSMSRSSKPQSERLAVF